MRKYKIEKLDERVYMVESYINIQVENYGQAMKLAIRLAREEQYQGYITRGGEYFISKVDSTCYKVGNEDIEVEVPSYEHAMDMVIELAKAIQYEGGF